MSTSIDKTAFTTAHTLARAFGHLWASAVDLAWEVDGWKTTATRLSDEPDPAADEAAGWLATLDDRTRDLAERIVSALESEPAVSQETVKAVDDLAHHINNGPIGIEFALDHVTGSGRCRWRVDATTGAAFMGVCRPSPAWRRWRELVDAAGEAGPLATPAILALAGPEPERGNQTVIGIIRYHGSDWDVRHQRSHAPYPAWMHRCSSTAVREAPETWEVIIGDQGSVESRHVAAAMDMVRALGGIFVPEAVLAAIESSCPDAVAQWRIEDAEEQARRAEEEADYLRRMAALDAEP